MPEHIKFQYSSDDEEKFSVGMETLSWDPPVSCSYDYHVKYNRDSLTAMNKDITSKLDEFGFVVVTDVLTPNQIAEGKRTFYKWYESNDQVQALHDKVSTRGIFKHFHIGGTEFLWQTRTHLSVKRVYRAVHGVKIMTPMVTSLDGACFVPSTWTKKKDRWPKKSWVHTDLKPKGDVECVQGYVSYTNNPEDGRTTIFYRGSHKIFKDYYNEFTADRDKNKQWTKINIDYLKRPAIAKLRTTVNVPAGSMVLWNSRTFHSTQWGERPHERLVAYVCMFPKSMDTPKMAKKRKLYAIMGRTTSHWPCPIGVNEVHPQHYGNLSLRIQYDELPSVAKRVAKKAYFYRLWCALAGRTPPSYKGSDSPIIRRGKTGINTDDVFILGLRLGRHCFFHKKSIGVAKKARTLL